MPKLNQVPLIIVVLFSLLASGCVGTVVGAATDVAVEAAKVPFKVGGAVADVVKGDDDEDKE